ncbi:MAG: valine--tRNA ligase [Acidobacteriota bacterium]|nr:valine--tRNA ligase [Acidobacteriota bacterium]
MKKHFDPSSYEQKWQRHWSQEGFFRATTDPDKPSFCIMIPPPNVTGKLHIGHALQSALEDALVRWRRMQGYNALWLPGTDHAGIATQLMVERKLESEGSSRLEIGRERFLEETWAWKKDYHGNIRHQLDQLGASCDWTRERFTLDEQLSEAVKEAFVRLYDEGLIYRGEYIVNWSPVLQTAISDLEVEMKQVQGKLYHVAYPVEGSDERIVVATTRPETMLGDSGIAMHPEDERYGHLQGQAAILPLVGRRLPFVCDEVVDRDFGTGLVKVTPFHDPNDFEMGQRHDLESIQVIGRDGRMTEEAGEDFAGMDRFEARKAVVQRLEEEGFLVKVEPHLHNVGHSQRGGEPVEPMVSTQWFCDVSSMAQKALEAVEKGDLRLIPDSWDKTWAHWLENIRPWCISRQLWWGHRVPAWYTADGEVVVARDREAAVAQAGTDELTRDDDVLDTWFSSALWPFSTLGWPEETVDFKTFYPTDVLITGYDILFFWVARMVMSGLHFTGELPFSAVHLTGLVRDADGQKMSKTRGNTVDPLDLVEEHGADALRFTLCALDVPGRDIPLDHERIAGYRAFGNKIWNATRFALSRVGDAKVQSELDVAELEEPERWILSRLSTTAEEVSQKLETFRFDEACNRIYHFFWHELCDWYLELCKPSLSGDAVRPQVGDVVLTALDRSLRLLHPLMPFLTEELWQRLPGHEAIHPDTIVLAPYPKAEEGWQDAAAEQRMELLIELITRVRSVRQELNLPASAEVHLYLRTEDGELDAFLERQRPLLAFLGRLAAIDHGEAPEGASRDLVGGVEMALVAERQPMGEAERQRLQKEAEQVAGQIRGAEARLSNEQFLAKAPDHVVEGNRKQLAELKERHQHLLASLEEG